MTSKPPRDQQRQQQRDDDEQRDRPILTSHADVVPATTTVKPPAPRPCVSCPYRRDVPSGIWSADEYDKLPAFDGPTWAQDPALFLCHQQDGRLCAGWVACHDGSQLLAVRLAALNGNLTADDARAVADYRTDVPVWDSGAQAADHGRAQIDQPGPAARALAAKITRRQDNTR